MNRFLALASRHLPVLGPRVLPVSSQHHAPEHYFKREQSDHTLSSFCRIKRHQLFLHHVQLCASVAVCAPRASHKTQHAHPYTLAPCPALCLLGGAITWLPARWACAIGGALQAQLGGALFESSVSFALSSSVSHLRGNCDVADHGRRPTIGVGSSFSRAIICAPRGTSRVSPQGASARWWAGRHAPARRGTHSRSSTACPGSRPCRHACACACTGWNLPAASVGTPRRSPPR